MILAVFWQESFSVGARAFAKKPPSKRNAVHQGARRPRPTMMSAPGTWQCLEGPKFSSPWPRKAEGEEHLY